MDKRDTILLIELGRHIADIRTNHKLWSLENMSEYSGISRNHINLIEHGKRNPKITTLRKFAIAFDLPIVKLLDFRITDNDPKYFFKDERF